MFDYTKETIINSQYVDGNLERIQAITGTLQILRTGEYKVDYKKTKLVNNKVYKTTPVVGVNAKYTLTAAAGSTANAGVYRISINMKMNSKFMADYATAVWKFQKPVVVEIEITNGMPADKVAAKLASALNLAIPYNYKFIKASVNDEVVTVEGSDSAQMFDSIEISKYVPNTVIPSEGEYVPTNGVITVAKAKDNEEEFATGNWLVHNLRFPSYPNVRYNSINGDETPVMGELYTQYSFQYEADRKNLSGLGTVGQKLTSITNHVFYVINSLVGTFEAALKKAFGADIIANMNTIEIIGNDSVTKGATVTLMANAYKEEGGEVVPVNITWTLVDNSDNSGNKITLSNDQLTVASDATATSVTVKASARGYTDATKVISINEK